MRVGFHSQCTNACEQSPLPTTEGEPSPLAILGEHLTSITPSEGEFFTPAHNQVIGIGSIYVHAKAVSVDYYWVSPDAYYRDKQDIH